jgi:hypothetical protein
VSQWLEKNSTALIGLAATLLGALCAAVRILWGHLAEKPQKRIAELEAKLEAERLAAAAKLEASEQRHLKTALTLERLLGKYERERGLSSSQPPRST